MKRYLMYLLKWLLVVLFIMPGIMIVTGEPEIWEIFSSFGYPTWFIYLIGAGQILGALSIAFGRYINPLLPLLATFALGIIMTGAIYSHLSSHDPFISTVPAIINLVLLSIYLKFLIKERKLARLNTTRIRAEHRATKKTR